MHERQGQREILGEALFGMLPVDVEETHVAFAQNGADFVRVHDAAVPLQSGEALRADAVAGAVGQEEILNAIVRPIEEINADGAFAGFERERHRDEEMTFEAADLSEMAADAEFGLPMQEVRTDRSG
jgi:hypothetical protein